MRDSSRFQRARLGVFRQSCDALKKAGTLGIVEHPRNEGSLLFEQAAPNLIDQRLARVEGGEAFRFECLKIGRDIHIFESP